MLISDFFTPTSPPLSRFLRLLSFASPLFLPNEFYRISPSLAMESQRDARVCALSSRVSSVSRCVERSRKEREPPTMLGMEKTPSPFRTSLPVSPSVSRFTVTQRLSDSSSLRRNVGRTATKRLCVCCCLGSRMRRRREGRCTLHGG